MKALVFCGPTISADEVRHELDATCLPPVSQGDVYRATLERPQMIGIVDGYFRQVPSVWHKEILWAMSRRIVVFGSASMGALRAAELAAFGMIGVGSIFEDYLSGTLEDDDEVAVVHAPAEYQFRAMSEPMVNIRYTLENAGLAGIIDADARERLITSLKRIPYPLRSFKYLLEEAVPRELSRTQEEALRAWLPSGRVDQKREDARLMLRTMRERLQASEPASAVRFHFQNTVAWHNLKSNAASSQFEAREESVAPELLLEELYLHASDARVNVAAASDRQHMLANAAVEGCKVADEFVINEESSFRRAHGIVDDDAFAAWLRENDLSEPEFRDFLAEECVLTSIQNRGQPLSALPNHLRSIGLYHTLAARARRKQSVLITSGLENAELAETGLTSNALMDWHLSRIPREAGAYIALLALVRQDPATFLRAAIREYLFTVHTGAAGDRQV